jgi:hypothetical protein
VTEYTEDICPFFIQVGKKYHTAPTKILFIGKATNRWVTTDRDIEKLFDQNNPDRIVNRDDQLEWIKNLEGPNDVYNTKKSAFLRIIKSISLEYSGKEDWYNHIAWTDLYKISPWEGGNPNAKLQKLQRETCISILNEEINILKPDVLIFLTSGWENFYLESIKIPQKMNKKKTWNKYESYFQKFNDVLYIQSHHPQGKNEGEHKDAVVNILRKYY